MDRPEIESPEIELIVRRVVREAVGQDVSSLPLDAELARSTSCDSLTSLQILACLEQRLGLRFEDDALRMPRTLRELITLVEVARCASA